MPSHHKTWNSSDRRHGLEAHCTVLKPLLGPIAVETHYGAGIVESGSWWVDPEGNDFTAFDPTDDSWSVTVMHKIDPDTFVTVATASGDIEPGV